ncbi:MAG: hypothetical protein AUG48_03615 [Actinobacteria bacterium 13_1_20CM_3_68_9]|nr:MAG: hypothetical protein AUG48_03615 [Actinobacteria bacterium 13_1_20CM_3_68_9]
MSSPEVALAALAAQLCKDESVITPRVADPGEAQPALGLLAAAGPRAAEAPAEYALVIESIREGYLLHYGKARVVVGADADLALLAGDYLYALGLERLAALRDLEAVRELSDLISLSAQIHDTERRGAPETAGTANALWLASVTAVAAGTTSEHEQGKAAIREGRPAAAAGLWRAAVAAARVAGVGDPLERAAKAIGFQPDRDLPA